MTKFGIGQGVPRWEDPRLLRGGGRYSDDLNKSNQAFGYVLRSSYANANILSIDASSAKLSPGVLGIWTGKDYAAVHRAFGHAASLGCFGFPKRRLFNCTP